VPLSASLAAGVTALLIMAATRCAFRLLLELRRRPQDSNTQRLLVFGAGDGGQAAVSAMLRDPHSPYIPVGLLDDDPRKRKLRIQGVNVLGSRQSLEHAATLSRADALLIAIPSAGSELVTDLTCLAEDAGLAVKVLPSTAELLGDGISVVDIRDVSEDDLLGRRRVETDIDSVAGYITGKRVLVTGAGGSIGSELCLVSSTASTPQNSSCSTATSRRSTACSCRSKDAHSSNHPTCSWPTFVTASRSSDCSSSGSPRWCSTPRR
jgi:FlaA1/EpsC-like NDP-sugar epimerase